MKIRTNITLFVTIVFVLLANIMLYAQDKPRVSPSAKTTGTIVGSIVTVEYSQPSVKGRKIWGELVPYDKVWRTGANEATTFETSTEIKVDGQTLPAGKYSLFTIPSEKEWTVIFNKTAKQWGAFKYEEKEDQLRIKVKPSKAPTFVEQLTFFVEGNKVFFRWENVQVGFVVSK